LKEAHPATKGNGKVGEFAQILNLKFEGRAVEGQKKQRSKVKSEIGTTVRILLGDDINETVKNGRLVITPFDLSSLQPTSYDFAIQWLILDSTEFRELNVFRLEKGQSVLLLSSEYFEFPNDIIAHIWLRSSFARKLRMSSALGRVEAGWSGRLVVEIVNNAPWMVELRRGDRIATLEMYKLDRSPIVPYRGQYQGYGKQAG
jgi:deoxycytidine triphosphate deaminase